MHSPSRAPARHARRPSPSLEPLDPRLLFSTGPDLRADDAIPESLAVPYNSREVITTFATNVGDQPVPAGIDYSVGLTLDPNNPFAGGNFIPLQNGTTTAPVAPGAPLVVPFDPIFFSPQNFITDIPYYPVARFAPLATPDQDVDTSNNVFVSHTPIVIGAPTPISGITNGSFETGNPAYTFDGNGADVLHPGSPTIAGWIVVNNDLAVINNQSFGLNPQDGSYFLDLTSYTDSGTFGGVRQTVATTPGTTYNLNFFLGASPRTGDFNPHLTVSAGAESQDFANTGTATTTTLWDADTFTFTAVADTTTITLTGRSAQGNFIGLDNVSLTTANSNLPDLAVNSIGTSATTLAAGDTLEYGYSVQNVGSAPATGIGLDVYLASTADFTTGHPTRIDHTVLGIINPGGFDNGITSVTLPATLAPGQYFLAAYVDADNAIPESNENNNIAFQTAPITVTGSTTPPPVVIPQTGSLDPSFGNGTGKVTNTISGPPITTVAALTQPDAKLLSAGYDTAGNFTLTRNNTDGSLDTTFGNSGTARIPFGNGAVATAAALQPDGKILVAGYAPGASAADTDFAVTRINPDGSLDTAFATDGTLTLDLATLRGSANSTDLLRSLTLLKTGQILLTGATTAGVAASTTTDTDTDAAIVRLSPAGAIDPSFAQSGLATLDVFQGPDAVNALLIQPDNKLLLLGSATKPDAGPTSAFAARLLPNGQRDTKFATKGLFTSPTPGDQLTAAAFGLKGAIYLGGFTSSSDPTSPAFSSTPLLLRLNSKGKLDKSFKGGRVTPSVGTPIAAVNKLLTTPDGRVAASVTTANSLADLLAGNTGAAVLRLTTAGAPDPTFNDTGLLTLLPPPSVPGAPFSSTPAGAPNPNGVLALPIPGADRSDSDYASSPALPGSIVIAIPLTRNDAAAAADTLSADLLAAAEASLQNAFDALIADKQGVITSTPGGGIRAIATAAADANTTTQTIFAITPDAPDLAAAFKSAPSTLTAGKKSSATLTLTNAGSLAANATVPVQLYLSADATFSHDDVLIGTVKLKTKLNPRAAKAAKLTATPAKNVPAGTYRLIAVVNPNNNPLHELTENNNTATANNPITLTAAPAKKKTAPRFSDTPI